MTEPKWPSRWRMFRDAYAIYRREQFRRSDAFLLAIGFARGGP